MSVRFKARLTRHVEPGDRVVVDPEHIIEEWGDGVGDGRTSMIPRRVTATAPRRGVVMRVLREHADGYTVILEDQPAHRTTVGAVLTVVGPVTLTDNATLGRLLEHLAFRPVPNAVEAASVAVQCAPWLTRVCGHVIPNRWPDYPLGRPELWQAWLDGLTAMGGHVAVPPYPGRVLRALRSPIPSRPVQIATDVANRLARAGRLN